MAKKEITNSMKKLTKAESSFQGRKKDEMIRVARSNEVLSERVKSLEEYVAIQNNAWETEKTSTRNKLLHLAERFRLVSKSLLGGSTNESFSIPPVDSLEELLKYIEVVMHDFVNEFQVRSLYSSGFLTNEKLIRK